MSDDVEVGQRSGHLQPVQVLRQTAIADLAEAEDVLDHPEHVLDLGAHAGLVAVLRLSDLVDPAVEAEAAALDRSRCHSVQQTSALFQPPVPVLHCKRLVN